MSIALPLLMLATAQQSVVSPAIPEIFHGIWDVDTAACNGSTSTYRISIDRRNIGYWESDGKPVEIFRADKQDISLTLAMAGEGETWQSKKRFVVSDDGQKLFAEALPMKSTAFLKTIWFYQQCANDTKMGWGHNEGSKK